MPLLNQVKKGRKKEILDLFYYNCRGMVREERLVEFENALQNIKWDIVGLSVIRKKKEELIRRKNGNYFYYYGETKGQKGVWFYVDGKVWSRVREIKPVNERICVPKMEYNKQANRILSSSVALCRDLGEF